MNDIAKWPRPKPRDVPTAFQHQKNIKYVLGARVLLIMSLSTPKSICRNQRFFFNSRLFYHFKFQSRTIIDFWKSQRPSVLNIHLILKKGLIKRVLRLIRKIDINRFFTLKITPLSFLLSWSHFSWFLNILYIQPCFLFFV